MPSVVMKLAAGAALLLAAVPSAEAADTITGVFSLAGAEPAVEGQLTRVEPLPLTAELEITFTDKATGERIEEFTEELTQELHLLAVDSSLTTLVHEHVKAAASDGTFAATMQFPRPGLYHIYADAVPEGYGQQVLRFDVPVGEGTEAPPILRRHDTGEAISVSSPPYAVEIDASGLAASRNSMLQVHVSKDGEPAADLHPYLGVAAHAVLIKAGDLSYVHAHPTEGDAPMDGMDHNDHGAAAEPAGHAHEPADPAPTGHEHGHAAAEAAVTPDMILHLTPPGPGDYTLFLEFIGGDQVHTIAVPLELGS